MQQNNGQKTHTSAGVAIIIKNKIKNVVEKITPFNDRIISITLGSINKSTRINNYAYTAQADTTEKTKHYKEKEPHEKIKH